jgi:hypothetical protein
LGGGAKDRQPKPVVVEYPLGGGPRECPNGHLPWESMIWGPVPARNKCSNMCFNFVMYLQDSWVKCAHRCWAQEIAAGKGEGPTNDCFTIQEISSRRRVFINGHRTTPTLEMTPTIIFHLGAGLGSILAVSVLRTGQTPVPSCPGIRPGQFGTGFWSVRSTRTATSIPNRSEDCFWGPFGGEGGFMAA